ncbi:MAG TPA: alkaline phosphatase family protein [Lacunisphaera sp.]|jgi:arylsulfatase A-like enzyme|nr:alkaline phosphatase family protein [Lacunisphaera sp.]
MRWTLRFLLPSFVALVTTAVGADAPARRVVLIVWDGMRPDFVSPETTPNLSRLAADGVFFAHHHPVYLSATEVNGAALATGANPEHNYVVANTDYRPRINPERAVGIEVPAVIRKGDEASGGHYLGVPTVAETLHAHGLATVITGSKQVTLLHDRAQRGAGPGVSPVLYQGEALPPALEAGIKATFGDFPKPGPQDDWRDRDAWTTRVLLGSLWKDGVPPYTLLWLAQPDKFQHTTGPGSPQSLAGIKSSDEQLGLVLADLDRRGLRESTDVMVVSDHGFSTVARKVDVAVELAQAGFAAKRAAPGGLQPGALIVVGNGGTSLIYVGGHDADTVARVAAWLQLQDWVGVIFARQPLPGTFPLAEARIASPEAPDFVVSLKWWADKSANGTPGLHTSDMNPAAEKAGNHASLSAYDMHNTLVAGGPDFRRGVTDTLPTGNVDVAPTILWVLGFKEEAAKLDGRVLGEALSIPAPPLKSYELKRLHAERDTAAGCWTQYLQVSEVNGVRYFDEGNGAFERKAGK